RTLECGRRQLPDAEREIVVDLPGDLRQRLDVLPELAAFGRQRLERFERQTQAGHLLSELIVEITRDAPALVLLREHQACKQLRALFLDAPLVFDLTAKRLVGGREFDRSFPDALLELLMRAP